MTSASMVSSSDRSGPSSHRSAEGGKRYSQIDNHTSLAQITNIKCLTQLVAAATQSTGKSTDHYNSHSDTINVATIREQTYNLRCDCKCMYK